MNVRFQRHMMNRICWFRFCWIPPYLCVYVLIIGTVMFSKWRIYRLSSYFQ